MLMRMDVMWRMFTGHVHVTSEVAPVDVVIFVLT